MDKVRRDSMHVRTARRLRSHVRSKSAPAGPMTAWYLCTEKDPFFGHEQCFSFNNRVYGSLGHVVSFDYAMNDAASRRGLTPRDPQ